MSDGPERVSPRSLTILDGPALREALVSSTVWLERHIDVINSLNVFPVPDGDTGTNMFLTMQAALRETGDLSGVSVAKVMETVAHGALMGARGNSGVILSQILRGMARALGQSKNVDAQSLASSLDEGSKTAYKGVIKPVEGTILTVARETASAVAKAAESHDDLVFLMERAVQAASASVQRTPTLLPELREAGVVDAGGQGYLTILEGMLMYLRGEELEHAPLSAVGPVASVAAPKEYGYEALFVLRGQELPVDQIRSAIMSMGHSVLVVGDERILKVHVHTGRPGAVIDYAIGLGDVSDVVVENLQEQTRAFAAGDQRGAVPSASPEDLIPMPTAPMTDIAIVAVASGQGMQEVFRSLGASAVVSGGQTTNPSTQELLEALDGLPAENFVILPNNSNVIMAAQQAKELASKNVEVIATKTVPQGISALLAFNYQADLETNLTLMAEAADEIQTAEITTAVRSAQVNGLKVEVGQVIGLLNGELIAAGPDFLPVIDSLLERIGASDYDIITVYYGDAATPEQAREVADHIEALFPGPEVEVVNGGQPHYHYVISAE